MAKKVKKGWKPKPSKVDEALSLIAPVNMSDEAKHQWCLANSNLKRYADADQHWLQHWQKAKGLASRVSSAESESDQVVAYTALIEHVSRNPQSGRPTADNAQRYELWKPFIDKANLITSSERAMLKRAKLFISQALGEDVSVDTIKRVNRDAKK